MSLGPTLNLPGFKKAGPGRPKGSTSAKYISVTTLTEAIQKELGCSFVSAYATLLAQAREAFEVGDDRKLYPNMMIATLNRVVQAPKQEIEVSSPPVEDMTDEELDAQAAALAPHFIKAPRND